MKIVYFRLKGYIRVLNGMGLDEIIIDFKQFKNRIILVQGENGCSKSTIIGAMTPNPDGSDAFRTDVFIDAYGNRQIIEYPGEKEICYESINDNGQIDYYSILIQSLVDDTKTRRTTKAYISKNGEELNPNGNITSFKDIRDSVLGIDPIYLDLSSISSENRGIVDMIPSDRRKYMVSYIGSLDTYNNIFKVISKKVTTLKSYMNTLSTKIFELGDENELRLKLMRMESDLDSLNKSRDSLLKELAESEATISLLDPDGKIHDLYLSISDRLETLNSKIRENIRAQAQIIRDANIPSEIIENTDLLEKEINELSIAVSNDELSNLKLKTEVASLIQRLEELQSEYDSNKVKLEGISSNSLQSNIEITIEELKEEISMYKEYLTESDISILTNTSSDELYELVDCLTDIFKEFDYIESLYDESLFVNTINKIDSISIPDIENQIKNYRSRVNELNIEIAQLTEKYRQIESDLEILQSFNSTRPKECKFDDCPYISKYIKLRSNPDISNKELERVSSIIEADKLELDQLEKSIDELTKELDILNIVNRSLKLLNSKSRTISKISDISFLTDIEFIKFRLLNHSKFQDIISILNSLIERNGIFINMKKAEEQLQSLESELSSYNNSISLTRYLQESITNIENKMSDINSDIKSKKTQISIYSNSISKNSSKLTSLNNLYQLIIERISLDSDKDNLKKEFELVKDKIKVVKDKSDSINMIKQNIDNIEKSSKPLTESITEIKFSLANLMEYKKEYQDSSDRYEKILFIRNACSPGNGMGIQSEYVKRYMNDIIIDCNKMLGYMFNGAIQLSVPIINEKQFSIPFMGPNGIIVPDISNGSTAQKCMIGLVFSCIAMMKSSTKYNIPRFDEIDGGLDQQNRSTFINVLNQILDFMGSEQCIICSHNNEFDTQSTTRILCSHTGIKIEQ